MTGLRARRTPNPVPAGCLVRSAKVDARMWRRWAGLGLRFLASLPWLIVGGGVAFAFTKRWPALNIALIVAVALSVDRLYNVVLDYSSTHWRGFWAMLLGGWGMLLCIVGASRFL